MVMTLDDPVMASLIRLILTPVEAEVLHEAVSQSRVPLSDVATKTLAAIRIFLRRELVERATSRSASSESLSSQSEPSEDAGIEIPSKPLWIATCLACNEHLIKTTRANLQLSMGAHLRKAKHLVFEVFGPDGLMLPPVMTAMREQEALTALLRHERGLSGPLGQAHVTFDEVLFLHRSLFLTEGGCLTLIGKARLGELAAA
jgi:hypothetical protein